MISEMNGKKKMAFSELELDNSNASHGDGVEMKV